MSPQAVAQSSIDALGHDLVHVPGIVNKALATLGAALPIRWRTAAAGAVLRASLGV
jgi:short-subunit dehydrogenase